MDFQKLFSQKPHWSEYNALALAFILSGLTFLFNNPLFSWVAGVAVGVAGVSFFTTLWWRQHRETEEKLISHLQKLTETMAARETR